MRLVVLGSGSRGNAIVVEDAGVRLLVDAGFGVRTLAERLRSASIDPASIDALLLTHEHGDHACGAAAAVRRWGWPVLASAGTLAALPALAGASCTSMTPGTSCLMGTWSIEATRIPHDAAEPVAFVVALPTGGRVGIAHDLGHVPAALRAAFTGLDAVVLEANHDPALLRAGPYPPVVQARIAGATGHLSNGQAAEALGGMAHAGLRHVVLAHLSEQTNTPAHAREAVRAALGRTRCRGQVWAAAQDAVLDLAIGTARAREGRQLSLFG